MSGELQIVFIYDLWSCRKEEDDPKEAILYFHPADIPEDRRIAICGQLIGVTHFLMDTFTAPRILSLENGKFALRKFGKQYLMALGCSSITPDWLLEKQADMLFQLTRFFHNDILSILASVNGDRSLLSSKLSVIMDHYIPVSQHHGDLFALTFGILPILYLPKSANNISLNATLILQTCMLKRGVLGGIIMFQNKVMGVQIGQDVARKLAFIQPYQLPPADPVKVDYHFPPCVQLFTVYLSHHELQTLRNQSRTFQCPTESRGNDHGQGMSSLKIDPIQEVDEIADISSSIGFSEMSLTSGTHPSPASSLPWSTVSHLNSSLDSPQKSVNKQYSSKYEEQRNFNNTKTNQHPDKDNESSRSSQSFVHINGCHSNLGFMSQQFRSLVNIVERVEIEEDQVLTKKSFSSSLTDPYFPYVRCDGKSLSKTMFDCYARALQDETHPPTAESEHKVTAEEIVQQSSQQTPAIEIKVASAESAQETDTDNSAETSNSSVKLNGAAVITSTPTPAVGAQRPKDLSLNMSVKSKTKQRRWATFDDMMSPAVDTPTGFKDEFDVESNSKDKESYPKATSSEVTVESSHMRLFNSFRRVSASSHEELSSCYTSSDTESNHSNNDSSIPSHFISKTRNLKDVTVASEPKHVSLVEESYGKAILFIYGLGSMRLLLLLDRDYLSEDLLKTLWDYASNCISELEHAVMSIDEQSLSSGAGQSDHYCYLHYEPVWKSLAHGGRNHSMDFDIVQLMHQDFTSFPNINELIIRGEDHVVYGYHCVGSEVFYQQSAGLQPGLPMPSDLMGKVPLKAKRRLERDHNILLL